MNGDPLQRRLWVCHDFLRMKNVLETDPALQDILTASEPIFDRPVWDTSEFHCRGLAANVYLLTYTLLQDNQRLTRRSTIWHRTGVRWN